MEEVTLKQENQTLREELAQCKADKEFVWSLWKQLQKESPDITGAVDMVITREKLKQEQRHTEIIFLLSEKDKQISVMQKAMESRQKEVALASSELKTAEAKCTQEVVVLRKDFQELQTHYRKMVNENETLKEKCTSLEELLAKEKSACKEVCEVIEDKKKQEQKLREEVSMLSGKTLKLAAEVAQSKEKISNLMSKLAVSDEKCETLHNELSETCTHMQVQEEELLQLRNKFMNKMDVSLEQKQFVCTEAVVSQEKEKSPEGSVFKLLERTEAELFEVKCELKAKTEELQCLRNSHDKRLERIKWLKTNYTLACEQIKTYEIQSQSDVEKKTGRRRRHSENALKHEDSKKVWNELTKYKSLCEQMKQDLVSLEEERDFLKANCCRNQTTIAELRTCLQREKEDIKKKAAAIVVLEGSVSSLSLRKEKVDVLQHCVGSLEAQMNELSERNSELEKRCAIFYQERLSLESTIAQLQHEPPIKKAEVFCKATMTEPCQLPYPIPKYSPTKRQAFETKSKISFPKIPNKIASHHQRSYSEGDTLSSHHIECISELAEGCFKRGRSVTASVPHQCPSVPGRSAVQKPRRAVHSCIVRSCSTQTENRGTGVHRCEAQEKVKRLEQRLQILLKKVANESMTQKSLVQSLKEQASLIEKQKDENRELCQKLQGYRVSLKAAESEKSQLEETMRKLQDKVELPSTKCLETSLKCADKERKELHSKCSLLRSNNLSLQQTLHTKDSELAQAKKTQEKLERDLKQKRLLIEDYQNKLKLAQEVEAANEIRIKNLLEKLDGLVMLSSQDKHKLQLLKSQMAQQITDKEKLVSMLEKCQEELDNTIREMCTNKERVEKKLKAANNTIHRLSCDLESAKEQRLSLEKELDKRNEAVKEFKSTIQIMADELETRYTKHCRSLHSRNATAGTIVGGPSSRMREIAHSALQLSDHDIDDFFSDQLVTQNESDISAKLQGGLFTRIMKITRDFQPPFQRCLTSELITFLAHFNN